MWPQYLAGRERRIRKFSYLVKFKTKNEMGELGISQVLHKSKISSLRRLKWEGCQDQNEVHKMPEAQQSKD